MASWLNGKNTRNENPLSSARHACFTRCVKVDLGIWSKLTQLVIGLVVIAILLLIFMCYRPLIEENERMRREIMSSLGGFQDQEARHLKRVPIEFRGSFKMPGFRSPRGQLRPRI